MNVLLKTIFASLTLLLTTPAFATAPGACPKGEAKLVFAAKSVFQGRILISEPRLCANGQSYRIMGAQASVNGGYTIDLSTGLCRAFGFAETVSFDPSFLRRAERLAHFENNGAFSGIFPVYPDPNPNDHANYVIRTLTCAPKN